MSAPFSIVRIFGSTFSSTQSQSCSISRAVKAFAISQLTYAGVFVFVRVRVGVSYRLSQAVQYMWHMRIHQQKYNPGVLLLRDKKGRMSKKKKVQKSIVRMLTGRQRVDRTWCGCASTFMRFIPLIGVFEEES